MTIWTLSDLHLALGVPSKNMEVFGPSWDDYQEKMHKSWSELISPEDLVLLPGDISWAIHLDDALVDLNWIDKLPGTKVMIKGNHDYWWCSSSKMQKIMPPSVHFIYNNVFNWKDVTIGGTRLWDTAEYTYNSYIVFQENPRVHKKTPEEFAHQKEEDERIYARELERLKLSLNQLDPKAKLRIAMTHYPPLSPTLLPSRASAILEENKIDICIFGHLHNVRPNSLPMGEARGVRYIFASADYLDFTPIKVAD